MPPVMGAIDDHEAPGCRQRDGENQTDDPHESSHRAPPFCRVRRPEGGCIPLSARRSAVKSHKLVGGPGEERQPALPPGSGKERKEKRGAIPQAGGGAGGGATAGAPPRIRK